MRVLYHLPLSPFSRKIRLVLSEKRLPFELRLEKVWQRRPEYLELTRALDEYLNEATERIIREEVYRDARDAPERAG